MRTSFAVARPWSEMRPVKGAPERGGKSKGFPVYSGLESTLAGAAPLDQPHAIARHVCAVLSGWAYSDADTVATMMSRLGLEDCRVSSFDVANNALVIRSTAYLVQSGGGRVALLAYRGTDPFDLSTWAVDADVNKPVLLTAGNVRVRPESAALVHAGFYRNQRATWFEIAGRLKRALAGASILEAGESGGREDRRRDLAPLEALYVTGHSLGAAMATIAAYRIAANPEYAVAPSSFSAALRQVYLFAPPMVGNAEFKDLWSAAQLADGSALQSRTFAHTFARDVVPRVPPEGTTRYEHVAQHYESKEHDPLRTPGSFEWVRSARPPEPCSVFDMLRAVEPLLFGHITWRQLLGSRAGEVATWLQRRALGDPLSFADHTPSNYIACSQPPGVNSEFGDDF